MQTPRDRHGTGLTVKAGRGGGIFMGDRGRQREEGTLGQ